MARVTIKGMDAYQKKLFELGRRAEGVIKYAVYDGAAVIADAIKNKIPEDSGALKSSMSLTVMKNENGYIYTQINFPGYDGRGVPNLIKARVLESGSSTRQKRPFIRPAVNSAKAAAIAAMKAALDKKLAEIFD